MYSKPFPTRWEGLDIGRCPYCYVYKPSLNILHERLYITPSSPYPGSLRGPKESAWGMYECRKCSRVVLARVVNFDKDSDGIFGGNLMEFHPDLKIKEVVSYDIPNPARETLNQATNSITVAPEGAIMLASKAMAEMLKKKGFTSDTLFKQIKEATEAHILTKEMSVWAHEIRLHGNEQRHPNDAVEPPQKEDAEKTVNFALVLAEFLFVLPAKVEKGRNPSLG